MKEYVILILAIGLLVGIGFGFPLSNSDETVFVMGSLIEDNGNNSIIQLDVASLGWIDVYLVDTEDKFYSARNNPNRISLYDEPTVSVRAIYTFDVPCDVEISYARIQFKKMNRLDADKVGLPIRIDWEDYPITNNSQLMLAFYGASRTTRNAVDMWQMDIKITNLDSVPITIDDKKFKVTDQMTWKYQSFGNDKIILLPRESMRKTINFKTSILSRPTYLSYDKDDLYLDISSWV